MNKFDESVSFFENFMAKNPDYPKIFPNYILLNIWIQVAYAYFGYGNFTKVLEFLELIRSTSFDYTEYHQPFIFWLNLLSTKKLNQRDKLTYKFELFQQWLNQRKRYAGLLQFLNYLKPWFEHDNTDIFKDLDERVKKQHFVELQNFDLNTWIKSEVHNLPMIQFLKNS